MNSCVVKRDETNHREFVVLSNDVDVAVADDVVVVAMATAALGC